MTKLEKGNEYSKKNYLKRGDGIRSKLKKQNKRVNRGENKKQKLETKKRKYENNMIIVDDFSISEKNFRNLNENSFESPVGWNFKECEVLSCDPFLIRAY
jgi:hypothetical protein